ncbi:MAG: biotin-dependent carboxyltransferase family protein [Gemmatimonadota bacterium]|nr:biotin-dependent carboxyltransferase family protein [Gemmatimonadota bacterium]
MITVGRAPPYLTIQDKGRALSRSSGVPRGGAMDLFALQALNAIVGNPLDSAAFEWALGGGSVTFQHDCFFAFGGARARATLAGRMVPPFTTLRARAHDELTVEQLTAGRFLYIALSGGIDVPVILGSRATYLPGRFGGYDGRMVARGDSLPLGKAPPSTPPEGFTCPPELLPRYESSGVRIVRGTHADLFDDDAWATLTDTEFTLSTASDRTGYRLSGESVPSSVANLPSDPSCQGAIQIPGDGMPIVLMADAPTVGGYPKMAVVSEADLPILAQRSPGQTVRFQLVTIEQSQRALKRRVSDLQTIRATGATSA